MRLSLEEFRSCVRTKSSPSFVRLNFWLARSAVVISDAEAQHPIFGFSAGFCQDEVEENSRYELLERLVFLPYTHSQESAALPVSYAGKQPKSGKSDSRIGHFLIGSPYKRGFFSANGCAIHSNLASAIKHSQQELMERHICCEIWYKRNRRILEVLDFDAGVSEPGLKVHLYKTETFSLGNFALAVLECEEIAFFAMGAAVRDTQKEAFSHAVGEALMLFEDAYHRTNKPILGQPSSQRIMTLMDRETSLKRKAYFGDIVRENSCRLGCYYPVLETIIFEPFSKLYAARSFSEAALDPKDFLDIQDLPTLPLF